MRLFLTAEGFASWNEVLALTPQELDGLQAAEAQPDRPPPAHVLQAVASRHLHDWHIPMPSVFAHQDCDRVNPHPVVLAWWRMHVAGVRGLRGLTQTHRACGAPHSITALPTCVRSCACLPVCRWRC